MSKNHIAILAITTLLATVFTYFAAQFLARRSLPIPIVSKQASLLQKNPQPPASETSTKPITLIFTGDMMWDRNIRSAAQKQGYDFILEPLGEEFQNADLVVANLEGPITDNPSVSLGSEVGSYNNFIFTFAPQVAQTLSAFNIKVVNLGNNHILNFGQAGLQQTESYLDQAGIAYFGNTGDSVRDAQKGALIKEVRGVKLLFVNYNEFARDDPRAIQAVIAREKPNVNLVILYTHWGAEYVPQANQVIQELGHDFVDSGADLIIGSHPHVIQQKEVYRGKTIYYSLGNFVFDQYFQPEVMQGLLVKVEIDPETKQIVQFTDQLVTLERSGQTKFLQPKLAE